MTRQLPTADPAAGRPAACAALRDHVVRRAAEARAAYGPVMDEAAVRRMLGDRSVVRFPTRLVFDAAPLEPGEFAYPARDPQGEEAESYILSIHPAFRSRPDVLPLLIAYQLVRINYGDVAGPEEAEAFGATLLNMDVEDYYAQLCDLVDGLTAGGGAGSGARARDEGASAGPSG